MFLLILADRYRQRGYSSTEIVLRLTRQKIDSYIGLEPEAVSRQLAAPDTAQTFLSGAEAI